jgi:alpha-ketoglutarate-dependent taurine dioxygenase
VRTGLLRAGEPVPLLVTPATADVDLVAWAAEHRAWLEAQLLEHGGVLFRGFGVTALEHFERLARAVTPELLDYTNRSTPRTQLASKVYTSTEYPAEQWIPLHNEMSFARDWPLKIWFCCVTAAAEGGETPIGDSVLVYQRIDPAVRARFEKHGVLYVRNYAADRGAGFDLPWTEVFQTEDRREVEARCRQVSMDFEWLPSGALRTRQVCQAVARHYKTGAPVWFNQAHLFHVSNLPAAARTALTSILREDELPRNAYFGDGSPIDDEALANVRAALQTSMIRFRWESGDVMLLDNARIAHARSPFVPPRKVVVAMAEPYHNPAYADAAGSAESSAHRGASGADDSRRV